MYYVWCSPHCVAVLRMEEEANLKAVLEMSKKDAVEGAVQEAPPTDNESGLDGGLGRVQGV